MIESLILEWASSILSAKMLLRITEYVKELKGSSSRVHEKSWGLFSPKAV